MKCLVTSFSRLNCHASHKTEFIASFGRLSLWTLDVYNQSNTRTATTKRPLKEPFILVYIFKNVILKALCLHVSKRLDNLI